MLRSYFKGEKTCSGKGSVELLGEIDVRMEELSLLVLVNIPSNVSSYLSAVVRSRTEYFQLLMFAFIEKN